MAESDDNMIGGTCCNRVEKEHMFDKVVTPSDVGKLNRLVIPKQHAEKFFPLDSSDKAAAPAALLLNFEDDHNGAKSWRFRYSYWSSSQSYVMTKGWSRFVKDKKLDAGDIVSFRRGIGQLGRGRLFIDSRPRPDPTRSFPCFNFGNPAPCLRIPQMDPLINYHRATGSSDNLPKTLRLFGVTMMEGAADSNSNKNSSSSSTYLDLRPDMISSCSDRKGKSSFDLVL